MGSANFDVLDSDEFRSSPLSVLYSTQKEVRRRLSDSAAIDNSPFLADMREEGVTDYLAFPLRFTDGSIHSASWTTKWPGGFTEDHIEGLRKVVPPLARVIEIISWRRTASNLLDTYVGNRAGERILAGQIRRGHTDTMHAAIWLSDLRGFTRFRTGCWPKPWSISSMATRPSISAITHGGSLKFMGRTPLAVFPIDSMSAMSSRFAERTEAARESRASVEEMHYPIGDVVERFRFGVALHVGRILYGNIGGGNRLDFTCIGPAVNLAARLEKIAGRLSRTIVASAGFAGVCPGGWADLGEFPIAGFAKAERVYGLQDETPAA
jgi:adenylate cyclase